MGENMKIRILITLVVSIGQSTVFLAPRTPQQNKVIKRKNRTLQNKMAITMLNENDLPKYILAEMVNTTCYVLNRVLLRLILKKTLYEL